MVNGQVALGITAAGGMQVAGLARCGSRWCPDCWGKVASYRTGEIEQVAEWAQDQGHQLALVTLTAAHVTTSVLASAGFDQQKALEQQSIKELFTRLSGAWRRMNAGRRGKALKGSRIGYARAFELTADAIGASRLSGVHGHFHVLLVLDEDVDADEVRGLTWEGWSAGCMKEDLEASPAGFDFKILRTGSSRDIRAAAAYLVKGEKRDAEKLGLELTRSDVKVARLRVSPEGLLREIGELEDTEFSRQAPRLYARWRAIEDACDGRRWLTWSRDLRKLAGLTAELTDEEIARREEHTVDNEVLVVRWSEIRDHVEELRAVVREARTSEKSEHLRLALNGLGLDYVETSEAEWRERVRVHVRARYQKQ
ncbi:protein rep [Corynebacterium cystitidis]|uniref:protein rep n=1 Tax=Corynebacterium cystitidis TaxID=35757 RepID=UPI00115FE708|nr:protein rep [Corynebacterium cystitidis]